MICVCQITRGLLQKYGPDRVKDTPITEVRHDHWQLTITLDVLPSSAHANW